MKKVREFIKKLLKEFEESNYRGKLEKEVLYLREEVVALREHLRIAGQLREVQKKQAAADQDLKDLVSFFKNGMQAVGHDGRPDPVCPGCDRPMKVVFSLGKYSAICDTCSNRPDDFGRYQMRPLRGSLPGSYQTDSVYSGTAGEMNNVDDYPLNKEAVSKFIEKVEFLFKPGNITQYKEHLFISYPNPATPGQLTPKEVLAIAEQNRLHIRALNDTSFEVYYPWEIGSNQ